MSGKAGTSGIADIKIGSANIAKVLAGTNVVWQKTQPKVYACAIDTRLSDQSVRFEHWSSDDAVTWTRRNVGNQSFQCYMLASGNGMIIGPGDYGVGSLSYDGTTWYSLMIDEYMWRNMHISFGNGVFVVAPDAGHGPSPSFPEARMCMYFSTDGVTWNRTFILDQAAVIEGLCFDGTQFIAKGQGYIGSSLGYFTAASTNGRDWSLVSNTMGGGQEISGTTGKYVTPSNSPSSSDICFSTDLINWTPITVGSQRWVHTSYGNDLFVVDSYYGDTVAYSSDGTTWNTVSLGSGTELYGCYFGDNKHWVYGKNSSGLPFIAWSTDGSTWTQQVVGTSGFVWGFAIKE